MDGAEFTYDDKVLSVKDYNVRIDYGSFSANASIFVKSKEPVTDNEQITVNFSLYGDTKHGENGNIHTYKNSKDKLESWIVNADIRVNKDTTVNDVLVKALTDAGISWSNAGGNYVSSINGLSEFDNGPNSGWMYLLNGVHSKWGVAEQKVNNGDKIIFHYTDDYTKESDAENWGKPEEKLPTVGGSVDSIVKEDEATSVVKKSDMDKLISDAVKNEATVIELTVKGAEKADKITVEMPKQSVADVAEKTDVVFSVNTPLGIVSFDRKAMNEAVKQATGDTVKVVFEKLSATVTKVALTSADKEFTDLGTAKVKINLPVSDDLKDKNIAVAYTGKDGKLVKPAGKVVTIDGKKFCQIEISVIGEITLDEEAKIDELINAQDGESEEAKLAKIKDGVKNTAVKAESTAGKSKGKPYIKLNWAKSKGYKVDYFEVYKSNKKGSFSKTPYFKTKNGTAKTYKNTKELKKGIRYYYKVRGVRKVDGKKVYTKWSNVANRVSK